jgi:hypothetical protein
LGKFDASSETYHNDGAFASLLHGWQSLLRAITRNQNAEASNIHWSCHGMQSWYFMDWTWRWIRIKRCIFGRGVCCVVFDWGGLVRSQQFCANSNHSWALFFEENTSDVAYGANLDVKLNPLFVYSTGTAPIWVVFLCPCLDLCPGALPPQRQPSNLFICVASISDFLSIVHSQRTHHRLPWYLWFGFPLIPPHNSQNI